MSKSNHQEHINLIWQIADLLRGPYRPPQYERVMLPAYSSPDKPTVSKGYAELKEIFRQEEGKNETERIDVRLSHWFTNSR